MGFLAGPVAACGELQKAARLLGYSEQQLEKLEFYPQMADETEKNRYAAGIRDRLGDKEFNRLAQEGRSMTAHEALSLAMGASGSVPEWPDRHGRSGWSEV